MNDIEIKKYYTEKYKIDVEVEYIKEDDLYIIKLNDLTFKIAKFELEAIIEDYKKCNKFIKK